MKSLLRASVFLSLLSTLNLQLSSVVAQSTAITYQGRLNDGGAPANGSYDLLFILHGDAVLPGFQVGLPRTNSAVAVSNGLFTTVVDFGPAFDHQPRWLELAVKPAGSTNDFVILAPRQAVTVAPKADFANRAQTLTAPLNEGWLPPSALRDYVNETITGFYTFDSLPGNPPFAINSPALVANLNSDKLDGLDSSAFWKLGGNTGTTPGTHFLGTADNQPLEFKVNGQRALRLEPAANGEPPNLIGGSSNNVVAAGVNGATIAGGVENFMASNALRSVISGGRGNSIQDGYSTIGGGVFNHSYGMFSTIGGGADNNVNASGATVSGGRHNGANAENACVAGGSFNYIAGGATESAVGGGSYNWLYDGSQHSVISGGYSNTIAAYSQYSSIVGGEMNTIGPNARNATILGGQRNTVTGSWSMTAGSRARADHYSCFVWNSSGNDFATTGDSQFLISASGGVGINKNNPAFGALDVNGTVKANAFSSSGNVTIAAPGSLSFGTLSPAAQLDVSGSGLDSFPQARLNQTSVGDYSRLRFTVGGDYSKRWDMACRSNTFVLYSGQFNANMLQLDSAGLTVRGTFVSSSDRNLKENFQPVDARAVLDKVAALPLNEWNYKLDATTRHIGPMAQDFHAAFGVGPDDKHIATVDADGVALAAIQGLNQKLQQKETEIAELKQKNQSLEKRLEALEQAILNQRSN